MIIDFSINRGNTRETGTLFLTSDGTNVDISSDGAYINDSGIEFTGTITGTSPNQVLNVLYTSTSTGSAATMKYMIRRWSNGPGGPNGPPSYSVATGGTVSASGPNGAIQFNSGGIIDGSGNFIIDPTNGFINLNGLHQSILSAGITMVDNTSSPAALFSYAATTYPFAVVEYSVVRDGDYRTGRLMVANDGTISSQTDDYVETNPTGVVFSTAVVGSNVIVMYTTTATGFNGTFKYSMRSWS